MAFLLFRVGRRSNDVNKRLKRPRGSWVAWTFLPHCVNIRQRRRPRLEKLIELPVYFIKIELKLEKNYSVYIDNK